MVSKFNKNKVILFAADSMLGSLAKCLRIMGYDTIYKSNYKENELLGLSETGRIILTKNWETHTSCPNTLLINHDNVRNQIKIVDRSIGLTRDRSAWFKRCSLCNSLLSKVGEDEARENVPDFVFSKYPKNILFCPVCEKFYWPGTHKDNILKKFRDWGF